MARRYYSSTAVETTLAGSASNSATSITVTALSGFPNTTPWTAILDADTASEEVIEVTNVAGTTLTVTRGVDGTAAVAHNAGASFRHGVSARDFDEANDHVNDSTGVHGLGASSSVVGTTDTQTLTNKTIDIASNTLTGVAPVANPTITGVLSVPDGSASAPSITNTGDENTGIAFPAADTVAIATGGTERLRVDSSGRLLVGRAAANNVGVASGDEGLQLSGNAYSSSASLAAFASNASSPTLSFAKSRSATVGTNTVVNDGDRIGAIFFKGADGTNYETAALIEARVDGTPGDNDMPGRLGFFTTADGTNTSTERMRIDSNGLITGTGTSLGAWTAYTPTLAGTGWAIGNGTTEGWWMRIGKLVAFQALITIGSTTTSSATTPPTVSLPTNSATGASSRGVYSATARDVSLADWWMLSARGSTVGVVTLEVIGTNGELTPVLTTSPFTWADTDFIRIGGVYEAA